MKLADIITQNLVLEEKQLAADAELVRQIQARFAELGYYPKQKVDGAYGPKTIAANVNFCGDYHLDNFRTGRYGATWARALVEAQPIKPNALSFYTKGKPYLLNTFTGNYDQYNFKIFLLQLMSSSNKPVDQLHVISGSPIAQQRELPNPEDDYSGSGNPIPEGIYRVGSLIHMASPEKGVGYTKISLDVMLEFRVNNRGEFLAHDDPNREVARGSLGCLVTYNSSDMNRIVAWVEQRNKPEVLVVSYNKGLLKSKGVEL